MARDDPKWILYQAECFRRAAIVLEGAPVVNPAPGHVKHSDETEVILPLAVCSAFAFELYLKFIIRISSGKPAKRIHDLEKLFADVPKEFQDRIRDKWNHPPRGMAMKRAAIATTMKRLVHPNFDETLKSGALAFERLRYAYEADDSELQFIAGDIGEFTRNVILEKWGKEYADVRLPLPPGVLNMDQQNSVHLRRSKTPVFK
jgi:hypothetical protein